MTNLDELLNGESKNVEYKQMRPKDYKKYIKTVVAFANGDGGNLIFGIEDHDHKITGIPEEKLFTEMDAISNVIRDSCEPAIIPDISIGEAEGKQLILVEISAGMQKPYYIKADGMREGTYVRVAGTTRQASQGELRGLILDGEGKSQDSIVIESNPLSEQRIKNLCRRLTAAARRNAKNSIEKKAVKSLSQATLQSWGILIQKDDKFYPTYAYNILCGDPIPDMIYGIQCAVFKGKTRSIFVDRKTYEGPIDKIIDEAYDFVLRSIRLGANINGMAREDVYEFPIESIREMISNAVAHRSYLQPGYVQVALYDDRLEVTSPGMLPAGMTLEKAKGNFFKIRNIGLANALSYMNIIENWGSGIPRIIESCSEYGLVAPDFMNADGDFRVTLFRNNPIESVNPAVESVSHSKSDVSNANESLNKKILEIINSGENITTKKILAELNISDRTLQRKIAELKNMGKIERVGGKRYGHWIVKK